MRAVSMALALVLVASSAANAGGEIALLGGAAVPTPPRLEWGGKYYPGPVATISIAFAPKGDTNEWVDILGSLEFARLDQDPYTSSSERLSRTSWEMWDFTGTVRIRARGDRSAVLNPYLLVGAGVHYEDQSAQAHEGQGSPSYYFIEDERPHVGSTMHLGFGLRVGTQTAFLAQARYALIHTGPSDDLNHLRLECGLSLEVR